MGVRGDRSESIHAKWKGGRQWSYAVWVADLIQGAFYLLLLADRDQTARIIGLPSASLGWVLLLILILLFSYGITMSVSSYACYRATGLVYATDRLAFALAGGFDVGSWPLLSTHLGLYGILRWTVDTHPDPLTWLRTWWVYVLVSLAIAIVLTQVVGIFVFRTYRRRHPLTLLESLRGTLRFGLGGRPCG